MLFRPRILWGSSPPTSENLRLEFEHLSAWLNKLLSGLKLEQTPDGLKIEARIKTLPGSIINPNGIDGKILAPKLAASAQIVTVPATANFTATDYRTVTWDAHVIQFADGRQYSIGSGTTGAMTTLTFVYFDEKVSTSAYQVTTDYTKLASDTAVLIMDAKPALTTDLKAFFVAVNGIMQLNVNQISVNYLAALSASMGDLTSGSITLTGAGSYFRMGATPPSSATVGTGLWIDYTGIYCLKNSVQTVFIDSVNGGIKLRSPAAVAGKYIDIGVATADELQFFEGGVSKVRIGSSVFNGYPGISLDGAVALTSQSFNSLQVLLNYSSNITPSPPGYVTAIRGENLGTGAVFKIGLAGEATGLNGTKVGIYGSASGGGTVWAGYFDAGNVKIVNNLQAGAYFTGTTAGYLIPAGVIVMWSGSIVSIPSGWALCNGLNGTPDLRDRFIVGAGSTYAVAATGGAATVTLTTSEMPVHSHGVTDPGHAHNYNATPNASGFTNLVVGAGTFHATQTTSSNTTGVSVNNGGGGAAHENRPPYYALAYIMKL